MAGVADDRVGVAILGLDNWYHAYPFAEAVARSPRAALLAIADPDAGKARAAAERYGAAAWFTAYEEALQYPGVAAVVLTMATAAHAAVGVAAAAAGKHILCDKPIEVSLERADMLLRAAALRRVVLMMAFGRRFSPVYQKARELLRAGAIGEPVAVVELGRWPLPRSTPESVVIGGAAQRAGKAPTQGPAGAPGGAIPAQPWDPGWYAQPEQSGGGAFLDHAVHQVDALRWLLGSEVVEVSATVGNLVHKELPVEDYGIATLRFADGVVATVESTWTVVPPARTLNELCIGGSAGELTISTVPPQVRVYSGTGGVHYDLPVGPGIEVVAGHTIRVQQYQGVIDAFVHAIASGEAPAAAGAATGEDGRAASEVCLAAYEAARTGRVVRLPR